MKKILTIAVSIAAIFAIASCGGNKNEKKVDARVTKVVSLYENAVNEFNAAAGDTDKEKAVYDKLNEQLEEIFKEDYDTYKAEYDKYLEGRKAAYEDGTLREFEQTWVMTTTKWADNPLIHDAYQKWDEAFKKHEKYFYKTYASLESAYSSVIINK